MKTTLLPLIALVCFSCKPKAPDTHINDSTTPLHLMKPAYTTPYGVPDTAIIKKQLKTIAEFLEESTPMGVTDTLTDKKITDYSQLNKHCMLEKGRFRLTSYEWGVTYAAMLNATAIIGEPVFKNYVKERLNFLLGLAPHYANMQMQEPIKEPLMRKMVHPEALDDAGAMCAAIIRAKKANLITGADNQLNRYITYIMEKEFRLKDGTFARNRPHYHTVWLDDMYMALPAVARMGQYTGDAKYFREAIRQVELFKAKMWLPEKGLYRHGWVEAMSYHPAFHWARANGWAILTKAEILESLPVDFPGREGLLEQFRAHVQGLSKLQSAEGFWHQLLDRNDTYLETSATAIYTYCIAKGINEGWLDALTYGPVAMLGWNAVSTKITEAGEVEGTCVGTGMGFDPAFYAYRPVHKYAAHGYGPVIFAGSEIIRMIRNTHPKLNDSGLQFYPEEQKTDQAIFFVDESQEFKSDF